MTTETDGVYVTNEQMLVPYGTQYVSVVVHVREPRRPRAGTVFCFHDFTGNAGDFAPLAELLSNNGFTTVCPDMVGRGASGHFSNPRQYGFPNLVRAASAVIAKREGRFNFAVGIGWGGLLALASASSLGTSYAKLALANLSTHYDINKDPIIADAVQLSGRRFATLDEAMSALLATNEFACLTRSDLGPFLGRFRLLQGVYAPHFDDAIATRLADYKRREFDIDALIKEVSRQTLLIGEPEGLRRTRLVERAELLTVLGFFVDCSTSPGAS